MSNLFAKKTVISTRFRSVFVASVLSMVSSYILILTDNVVAGQLIGEEAVAAMTLIFPIFTLLLFVSSLIATGLAMMASYAQGRNDREEIDRLFSLGMILSVGGGIISFAALFFFDEEILSFWEISPELKFFAKEYFGGIIFLALINYVNIFLYTFFFTEGMERACVIATGASFIVNVVADIVLCQIIGVRGIGFGTTLGTLVSVIIQSYFLLGGRSQLHFDWYFDLKKFSRGILYSFYHSVDTLCTSILPILLSMAVIENFGEEKIIVVTVAINLLTLIIAVYTGIEDCLQPMICQYHAEKNLHSVIKTMKIGMEVTVAVSLIMTLFGMVFADFLPAMFGVKDEILIGETADAMRYFLPFTIFLGCTIMLANYYIYIEQMSYGAFIKFFLLLILPFFGMSIGGNFSKEIFGQSSLNIFWFCTGFSFAVSFALNFILTRSRKGLLMIDEEFLNNQLSYDIDTKFDEVMNLTREVDSELTKRGVSDKVRNKIVLCIEELGLHAVERAGENIFQMEISILIGEKVTLIIRDNGKPYDVVKVADEGNFDFREFFVEGITSRAFVRRYSFGGDESRVTLQF